MQIGISFTTVKLPDAMGNLIINIDIGNIVESECQLLPPLLPDSGFLV